MYEAWVWWEKVCEGVMFGLLSDGGSAGEEFACDVG